MVDAHIDNDPASDPHRDPHHPVGTAVGPRPSSSFCTSTASYNSSSHDDSHDNDCNELDPDNLELHEIETQHDDDSIWSISSGEYRITTRRTVSRTSQGSRRHREGVIGSIQRFWLRNVSLTVPQKKNRDYFGESSVALWSMTFTEAGKEGIESENTADTGMIAVSSRTNIPRIHTHIGHPSHARGPHRAALPPAIRQLHLGARLPRGRRPAIDDLSLRGDVDSYTRSASILEAAERDRVGDGVRRRLGAELHWVLDDCGEYARFDRSETG
jgi:hypothetical protein